MRKVCSVAIIALMILGSEVYGEDIVTTVNIEESEKNIDDDAQTLVASEDSVESRINQQKDLIETNEAGKNLEELQVLQNNGFVITKKSLHDLEKNFNNAVTRVDLLEPTNINAAIVQAFDFAMDKDANTNFIIGEYTLPKDIKNNFELNEAMQEFIKQIKNPPENMLENDLQIKNIEDLKNICSILNKDKKIGKENVFSKFVKGMLDVYRVVVARRVADEILTTYRASTEDSFVTSRNSTSGRVGAKATNGVISGGGSVSYHKDEGSEDSSFYTVSIGGGIRLDVGVGVPSVGAELGVGADVTKSAIFYSLEQLLDSGKVSAGIFSAKELRKTLKSRQKMQEREIELLSVFGNDVEGYLKMIGKIPTSVYLEWPELTKSSPSEEAINISKQLDASISILRAGGFNVIANDDEKIWKRPIGYMTLISDDCSPSDGLSAADIVAFLGEQYDKSDTFGGKSDVNVLPIILGDIRAYNSVLNILSENKSDKNAETRKHEIEDRWIPKHKFTSEGRLGVLKAMITTTAVLRESAVSVKEIELFNQLYTEMSRLALLLEFSKNKSNRKAVVATESKAHNKAIQASATIMIPMFDDAQFSFTRSVARDNPFQEENGDRMSFNLVLPLTPTGIVGSDAVDASLNAYHQLTSKNKAAFDYGDTFQIAKNGFNLIKDGMSVPTNFAKGAAAGFSGKAVFTISMVQVDSGGEGSVGYPSGIRSEAKSETSTATRSLPNRNFITKKENEWIVLTYKGAAYLSSSTDLQKYLQVLDGHYSSFVGKEKIIIGTNTLMYLTSKFNAFSIGLNDGKDAMSPWYTLKNKQKTRLIELLKNITDDESNVVYELQNMYNVIMDNINEKDSKTAKQCTQTFADFLSACNDLANATDNESKEKAFEEASELMDKVFRMNFNYNFMNDYRKAYQLKK